MTKVTVETLTDVNGKQHFHLKAGDKATCYVKVTETGSAALNHVWVHCNSNDYILPDGQQKWPLEVTIENGTNQGSFKIQAVQLAEVEQALEAFKNGEDKCPKCTPRARCTISVTAEGILGTGQAIPISRVAPFPAVASATTGTQIVYMVEIDPSQTSIGDAMIAVDVSDRKALSSPSGEWPYFVQVNDPNALAVAFTVTVNSVAKDADVTVFAYGGVPYDPFHPSHFEMSSLTVTPSQSANRKRSGK